MMPFKNKTLTLSLAAVALALLAGCSSAPTRFYTLAQPAAVATAPVKTATTTIQQTYIEVMPVAVPERLARPQVVVRSNAAQLDVLEQDRWSSPFNSELRDALAAGVASRLGAIDVSRSGRPSDQVSYRITVELRDLDAVRGGQVQAAFGWTIVRSDDRKTAVCRLSVNEPVPGGAVADVVTATQAAVDRAAAAIAANVRALQAEQAGQAGQGVQCAG